MVDQVLYTPIHSVNLQTNNSTKFENLYFERIVNKLKYYTLKS